MRTFVTRPRNKRLLTLKDAVDNVGVTISWPLPKAVVVARRWVFFIRVYVRVNRSVWNTRPELYRPLTVELPKSIVNDNNNEKNFPSREYIHITGFGI